MGIVDKIILVDEYNKEYKEIQHKANRDNGSRARNLGHECYKGIQLSDCEVVLKKVDIDFTPNSTDVGLRYIYEVIYAT